MHRFETPQDLQRYVYLKIHEAFARPPDNAGILQGVRPFRSGLPHVRVVLTPSPKNGGHFIPCEGRLEAALAQALEVDPDVIAFRSQPFQIPGPHGRALVCDFVLKWANHTYTLVDVKPRGQLDRPGVMARMAHVRAFTAKAKIPHRVISEVELEHEPHRAIRQQLRKGAGINLHPGERETLTEMIGHHLRPLGDFRADVVRAGFPVFCPEKLALLGELSLPISAPLRETTLIGVTHGANSSSLGRWGTVRDVRLPL